MKKILLLSLLLSCNPTSPLCSTECGLQYYGVYRDQSIDIPQITCDSLQAVENKLLYELTFTTDERINIIKNSCQKLYGHWILATPRPSWIDSYGREVSGLTYCDERTTIVGVTDGGDIYDTATAHELVHVLQYCHAKEKEYPNGFSGHENWTAEGIFDAVDRVNER